MEADWVCKRAHLRSLLLQHSDWSLQQLADAVGYSKSTVSRWKRRFREADPGSVTVLFSRSRAPHQHPAREAPEVVERIIEIRLSPPENLKRIPGPKAVLYYLSRDETLRQRGLRLPRSTRTSLPDSRSGWAHRACPAQETLSIAPAGAAGRSPG